MKVLITGTASGIGKGCAEFFLKENHEVYGFDKNISSIQHPKYTHFCLDIRDKSSYPEIGQVDILINNAGVQNGDDIDVNLKGTISVTEHYGIHPNIYSIIMIGSASGHTGSEFPEYAASKGGAVKYQPLWKHFSSSIFTRMISSPIWLIHSQGMIYSLSRPNRQQNLPGPGSIRAVS